MLTYCQPNLQVAYIGPAEAQDITAAVLSQAVIYVQPGGNDDLGNDWKFMAPYASIIQSFVQQGGRYLGSCTGGYMSALNPWVGPGVGYGLVPGNAGEYIASPGASVTTPADTVVPVIWNDVWGAQAHPIYFQDGNYFTMNAGATGVTVLSTFASNGEIAALVARFGQGKVAAEGPHAEAPADWYSTNNVPSSPDFAPGCDLIRLALAP
jgi:glutamine amidotransferase-like uncharacterized protein